MKKNYRFIKIILIIFCILTFTTKTALAEIKMDANFDSSTHLFEGQTEPNATIYMDNVAGFINADSDGKFALTLPDDQKEIKLTIFQLDTGEEKDFSFNLEELSGDSVTDSESSTNSSADTNTTNSSTLVSNLNESSASNLSDLEANIPSSLVGTDSSSKDSSIGSSDTDSTLNDSASIASINANANQIKKNGLLLFSISIILIILLLGTMYYFKKKNIANNNKDD